MKKTLAVFLNGHLNFSTGLLEIDSWQEYYCKFKPAVKVAVSNFILLVNLISVLLLSAVNNFFVQTIEESFAFCSVIHDTSVLLFQQSQT